MYWVEELGISEALWTFEVDQLGPLLVEGDVRGNSFFSQVNEDINQRLGSLYEGLKPPVFGRIAKSKSPRLNCFRGP